MTKRTRLLFGLLAGVALPLAAFAQPATGGAARDDPPGSAADAPSPPPEKIAPADRALGDTHLSDRLSRQQGTLQPPSVDPGIQARHHDRRAPCR